MQRGIQSLRFFEFGDLKKIFSDFSRKEKYWLSGLLIALGLGLGFGLFRIYINVTSAVPTNGGVYIEGEIGQPRFVNPLLAQSQTDKDIARLTYAGLYQLGPNGGLIPDLADNAPQISKDEKQYTVKLRPNLKWSDGQPITADDIIFTIQTLKNASYKSPLRRLWQNITVEKIDDLTVRFKNPTVSAPFVTNFSLGILPQHVWQDISADQFSTAALNLEPVSSGPYFVKEIRKAASGQIQALKLESFSNYWQGKPLIDNIQFSFYQNYQDALFALHSKEIQGLEFIPFDEKIPVDSKTSLQVLKLPLYEYQALFLNLDKSHKILGDPAVRAALSQALNRNELINDIYFGFASPIYGPIMPGQIGYDADAQNVNPYNVDNAKSILDKAGWVIDSKTNIRTKDGQQLKFAITTNDFAPNINSAKELIEQWKNIGADVSVNVVPSSDLEQKYIRPRNFESLLFAEKVGADPDPFFFWHSSQAKDPGANIAQYRNALADKLIADGRSTFDQAARVADYTKFQMTIATDAPAIFTSQTLLVYELNKSVKGVATVALANPEDRFYDVVHWYIDTKRVWR